MAHLDATVGGMCGAFNQSIGFAPRDMGRAVRANKGAADFVKLRAQLDPSGRFLNPYLHQILAGVEEAQ